MSVRETIISNLETALKTITVDAGYTYDVGYVTRNATGLAEIDASRIPALIILDDGEELPEANIGTSRRATAKITIGGLIKGLGEISTYYNDFLADLRKCFLAANLGANVIYQRLGFLRTETGDGIIAFAQEIEILYYYPEANP